MNIDEGGTVKLKVDAKNDPEDVAPLDILPPNVPVKLYALAVT